MPVTYAPRRLKLGLAKLLGNLGIIYTDTHRFAAAEIALTTAVGVWRHLAEQNPGAYGMQLKKTLSSLALLYRAMHRDTDATAIEAEAKE
jgi:Tetratricopeptide repeat